MNSSTDDIRRASATVRILVGLFLSGGFCAPLSGQSVVGPSGVTYSERAGDRFGTNGFFSSDAFSFLPGPAWLMNQMPASRLAAVRSNAPHDRDGHRAADVGTPANPFKAMSFDTGSKFVSGHSASLSIPADPDGTWTAGTSGNWSDTANWAGGIVADFGGFANFSTIDLTSNVTVTIDLSSRIVRRVDIGDTNHTNPYTIAANLGLGLIFDNTANSANAQLNQTANSANTNISAPIVLNSSLDITNASGFSLNLSGGATSGTAGSKTITTSTGVVNSTGVIGNGSGQVAIVHNGPGTLRLSGANTYSGGTTVNGGIFELGSNGVVSILGTRTSGPAGTGILALNNGATLRSNNTSARTIQNDVTLSGNITLGDTANNGALTFNSTDGTRTLSTPATVTLNGDTTLATNSLVTIADVISGAFKLTKTGSSTLILSGTNIYTGTTTISGGTLQLGNGGTTGSLSTSSAIVDNANLTFNRTNTVTQGSDFSAGGISGSGSVTQAGSGVLLLNAANTYTGDTNIKAGELFLTPSGSLLATSAIRLGDTSANSPSAMFTFGSSSGGVTLANALTVQASASGTEGRRTLLGLATTWNTNTWSGNITMNTDLTVQSAAVGSTVANGQGILTLSGTIDVLDNTFEMNSNLRGNNADTYSIQGIVRVAGPLTSSLASGGSVVKDGSGTLILENAGNSYTGTDANALNPAGTRIRGGVLGIVSDTSLGLAPANIFGANNIFFESSAYNTNSDSIAPTLRAYADGIVISDRRQISIANGVTAQFDSNGYTFTINGSINGAGNLTKTGAGTLVLTSGNFYSGTTTVNAGTLNVNDTFAIGGSSSITVNRGGTLLMTNSNTTQRISDDIPIQLGSATGTGTATFARSGSGVVSEGWGASRNGATVLGGSATGLGALTLASNSTFDFGTGGVGTFTFAGFNPGTSTLTITNWTSNASFATLSSGVDGTDDRLIFAGITPPNTAFITFDGAPATFLLLDAGFYEVLPAPIPEPSTWIGAALALGAIGFTQRRKLRALLTTRA